METKPTEQVPKFFRIEIKVALSEDQQEEPLYTLTAFMSSDLKIDPVVPGGEGQTPPDEDTGGGGETGSGQGVTTGAGQDAIPGLDDLPQGIVPDGQ